MTNIATIIARGGSKGLPNKALQLLDGKPLIEWTINHALDAKLLDDVVLSSDGDQILAIGRRLGINAYRRPAHMASDTATIDHAVCHGTECWETQFGRRADNIVILYGNIALRPTDLIDRALEKMETTGCDSVQSVYSVGKNHPYWYKKLSGPNGDVLELYQNNHVYRRQNLPPVFMLDGGVVVVSRPILFSVDRTDPHYYLGTDQRAIITEPGDVIDIDTPLDLIFSETVLAHHRRPVGD